MYTYINNEGYASSCVKLFHVNGHDSWMMIERGKTDVAGAWRNNVMSLVTAKTLRTHADTHSALPGDMTVVSNVRMFDSRCPAEHFMRRKTRYNCRSPRTCAYRVHKWQEITVWQAYLLIITTDVKQGQTPRRGQRLSIEIKLYVIGLSSTAN